NFAQALGLGTRRQQPQAATNAIGPPQPPSKSQVRGEANAGLPNPQVCDSPQVYRLLQPSRATRAFCARAAGGGKRDAGWASPAASGRPHDIAATCREPA